MPVSSRESRNAAERGLVVSGFRYAFSLTHHRQDAEDLVQEACLRTFRVHGDFRDKAYLYTTIRRLFFNETRRSQTSRRSPPQEPVPDGRRSHTDVVADRIDLDFALRRLSEHERELLYLNCAEGFTAAELSEFTGRPRGTILSQLARAKEKLAPHQEHVMGNKV